MAAKAKKSILYIILILLAVICLMPFALMMVNATRSGSEIVHSFTLIKQCSGAELGNRVRIL